MSLGGDESLLSNGQHINSAYRLVLGSVLPVFLSFDLDAPSRRENAVVRNVIPDPRNNWRCQVIVVCFRNAGG